MAHALGETLGFKLDHKGDVLANLQEDLPRTLEDAWAFVASRSISGPIGVAAEYVTPTSADGQRSVREVVFEQCAALAVLCFVNSDAYSLLKARTLDELPTVQVDPRHVNSGLTVRRKAIWDTADIATQSHDELEGISSTLGRHMGVEVPLAWRLGMYSRMGFGYGLHLTQIAWASARKNTTVGQVAADERKRVDWSVFDKKHT